MANFTTLPHDMLSVIGSMLPLYDQACLMTVSKKVNKAMHSCLAPNFKSLVEAAYNGHVCCMCRRPCLSSITPQLLGYDQKPDSSWKTPRATTPPLSYSLTTNTTYMLSAMSPSTSKSYPTRDTVPFAPLRLSSNGTRFGLGSARWLTLRAPLNWLTICIYSAGRQMIILVHSWFRFYF
jgi:hypothetical protein